KVAEEAYEVFLAHDQNRKCKKQSKVAEKTNEECESHLIAEEEA
ncbi:11878_t:CDS:1, partial [Funneliformis mosseae]